MGGAYIGIANDIYAVYWNPAGIFEIDNFEFSYTYTINSGYDNIYQHFLAAAIKNKTFSFGISYISMDPLIRSEDHGKYWFFGTLAKDISSNILAGISFGYREVWDLSYEFFKKFDFEIATKLPIFIELGILYKYTEQVTFGILMQNIINIRPGISVVLNGNFRIALDFYDILGLTSKEHLLRFGGEYNLNDKVFIRVGFYGVSYFNTGFGFKYKNLLIDIYLSTSPPFERYSHGGISFGIKL